MDGIENPRIDQLDERSDFVKKLEEIDVHNLSPENVEFLYSSIQDYFMKHFPVDKELVDKIPKKTVLLSHEDFLEKYHRVDSEPSIEAPTGFYDVLLDKSFIDSGAAIDTADLFSTLFHESLHFVGISQGAGLKLDNYKVPDDLSLIEGVSEDELGYYIGKASVAITEGATKIIEQNALEEMGINTERDNGYMPHKQIMSEILMRTTENYDQFIDVYFRSDMDSIRKTIEMALLPDEEKSEFEYGEIPTGEFVRCILNVGIALDEMEKSFEQDNRDAYFETLEAVSNAANYYANMTKEKKDV